MAKTIAVTEQPSTGIAAVEVAARSPRRVPEGRAQRDAQGGLRRRAPRCSRPRIVVMVTVFIFAAYFWLVDTIIGRAIEALLHSLTKH